MAAARSVVVTGASTGIGHACVKVLTQKGFHVFAAVRKQADADRLTGEFGTTVTPLLFDVTDQRAVADGAAMNHRHVADAHALADVDRKPGVAMQHTAVLHLRVVADGDAVIVTAHHAVEPDADIVAEHHVADDVRTRGDPVIAAGDDAAVFQGIFHNKIIYIKRMENSNR